MFRFITVLYLLAVSGAYASWQYTNGTGIDTTPSGFTYQATVTENPANTFSGTATLTAFMGTSASIPATVSILITVNTTNAQGQPIQYNEWVNCTVKGFSGFTLNSDASFSGNVNIIGSFNLNGNDLTVNGYVIHQSGSLTFGTLPQGSTDPDIRLEITGDYLQQSDSNSDGTFEAESYGSLSMNDAADVMTVGGKVQFWAFYGNTSLTAGVLEIKGDFLQKTGSYYYNDYKYKGFQATNTHRVRLSGAAAQTVTFQNPGPDASYFNILEVTNTNPLVFHSPVQASRVTGNTSISIQSPGEGGISGTMESDITCTASAFTILSSTDLAGHALTVNCPVKQLGSLKLGGGTLAVTAGGGWDQRGSVTIGTSGQLSVSGSWIHQAGNLGLNGGHLEIGGDYLQQSDGNGDGTYESACNGTLSMSNAADVMTVGGDAQFWAYYSNSGLSAGLLEIRGDFLQKTGTYYDYRKWGFQAAGTHRVKLSGTATQTVTFQNPGSGASYFNILEVTNPDPLVLASRIQAATIIRVGSPLVLQATGTSGIAGTLEADVTFTGNFLFAATMNLNGHTLAVSGDMDQQGELNLSGGNLTVGGSWIHQTGNLILNGGRLEITGDYLQQSDSNTDGTFEAESYGSLSMNDAADVMTVGGKVQFWAFYGNTSLTAGVLEIKGDFLQKTGSYYYNDYKYKGFQATNTHRVRLSGAAAQTVTFQNPGPDASYFNILEVTNTNPLVFHSPVQASRVTGNTSISIQSPGEGGISGTMESDITCTASAFTILSSTDLAGHALTVNCPVKQLGSLKLGGGTLAVTAGGGWDQRGSVTIGTSGQLSVSGSWIHQAGNLGLNGGHLEIGGDYLQQSDGNGDGTYESACNGTLSMSNAADVMTVGGDAQFWAYYSNSGLSAGLLEIRGDFLQKTGTYYDYRKWGFQAAGTHRVKLSGTATQTVTFQNPGSGASYFNILEVTNPDPLVLASRIQAATIIRVGSPLVLQATGTSGIAGTLEADVTFTGNFLFAATMNLNGHTLAVSGDMDQQGELNLSGGNLTVGGSWIHQTGNLILNGGRLEITGDYLQQSDSNTDGTFEAESYGSLSMNDAADVMTVGGKVQFWAFYGNTSLTAGVLEIKGDFLQKTGSYYYNDYKYKGFQATNTHRVRLSGAAAQTVTFQNPGPDASYFNILEVTNTNPLVFHSPVQASRVTGNTSISIQSPGEGGISGTMESDITCTASAFTILSSTDLAGHALTVNCPVKQLGSLKLGGGTLAVTAGGGWDQRGSVTIGTSGQLSVSGSWIHQAGNLGLNGGHLEIGGDYLQQSDGNGDGTYESACNGTLSMSNAADVMTVGGDAQFWAYYSNSGLSAGLLEIRGDFLQKTGTYYDYRKWGFQAAGTHRVKLSGTATQTVTFQNPGSGASYFNILEVTNPDPLVLASRIQAATIIRVGSPLVLQATGTSGIAGTLEADVTFTGNFLFAATMNLNGHTLAVSGDMDQQGELNLSGGNLTVGGSWIHQTGNLILNGGRLEITGDYLQQSDSNTDGTFEAESYGSLSMNDAADVMTVGGKVQFWAFYGNTSLTAGVLEIKGDFLQKTGSYYYNDYKYKGFQATNTHRVRLSGAAAQTVTFQNPGPDASYFNILEVTNHLADASIVSVANSGILKLDYNGTDIVSALTLGGVVKANGVYDSTNTGGLITGTGKIQVGPFANYAAWGTVNAPGQTTDQDHDHDGVPNGVEYFMGKTGNDFTANPGMATNGTVTWPKGPAFSGSYAVQTSADLEEWTDVTEDPAQVTKNTNSVVWTRPTGMGSRFVRLVVIPN